MAVRRTCPPGGVSALGLSATIREPLDCLGTTYVPPIYKIAHSFHALHATKECGETLEATRDVSRNDTTLGYFSG